ncbi:hypothetical protein [Streptomyces sp. C184]|uniref:hypothetical protein n=1 Tax=Streptomyces sp. C184 TaxID=3237121 RepID=UPI0034C6090F
MADLLWRQDLPFLIEFSHFTLQESDEDAVPVPYPDAPDFDAHFLTEHVRRIDVVSAGHTHWTTLECEVWDARPPADDCIDWDEQVDAHIDSPSGEIVVWTGGGAVAEDIHLGRRGTNWGVRINCVGRKDAQWQASQGVPSGVERYSLQFWPMGR